MPGTDARPPIDPRGPRPPCTVSAVAAGVRPTRSAPTRADRPRLGWREWVALPDWNVPHLKAKVDTGARTSSLHAFDLERSNATASEWVRFTSTRGSARRSTRSSPRPWSIRGVRSGVRRARSTNARSCGPPWCSRDIRVEAEVTLTRRDEMGFRMLIGREAIRITLPRRPRRVLSGWTARQGDPPTEPGRRVTPSPRRPARPVPHRRHGRRPRTLVDGRAPDLAARHRHADLPSRADRARPSTGPDRLDQCSRTR